MRPSRQGLIQTRQESFNSAQREKRAFSRNAIVHIVSYETEEIPAIAITHPSKILRLWLETFPDLASQTLGEFAACITIHVDEPGADPMAVRFDRKD
ncbi:hypothetical protein H7142_03005 [Candidatus Saccharibacteria bacterium]|nr:hypothetical protein [Candidatus Saccharibacteria bacterium]